MHWRERRWNYTLFIKVFCHIPRRGKLPQSQQDTVTAGKVQWGYLVINYTSIWSKPLIQLHHSCISNYGWEKQLSHSALVLWTAGDSGVLVHPDLALAHQVRFSCWKGWHLGLAMAHPVSCHLATGTWRWSRYQRWPAQWARRHRLLSLSKMNARLQGLCLENIILLSA